MLLAKAVPKGIKDQERKRFALGECPPVPYVPEKDPVQETVSLLKSNQSLKTTIGADAELCLPIWHCGTREAFLMHVSSAFNAKNSVQRSRIFQTCLHKHVLNGSRVKEFPESFLQEQGSNTF
jgi:hypothetical protein